MGLGHQHGYGEAINRALALPVHKPGLPGETAPKAIWPFLLPDLHLPETCSQQMNLSADVWEEWRGDETHRAEGISVCDLEICHLEGSLFLGYLAG